MSDVFVPQEGDNPRVQGIVGGGGTGGDGGTVNPIDADAERLRKEIADLQAELQADRVAQRQLLEEQTRIRQRDARQTIRQVLETYGLAELADFTYTEIIAKETVNINNPDAIVFALREQPAFQKRFAGNAARLKKGLPELTPAEYLSLEDQYRTTLRANGLPTEFYDAPDDFQQLIEGDVSIQEFNERIGEGYRAVADADPEVKRQMKQLYGVTDGDLAAYFLDPAKAAPLLTRQARAAQIAARSAEQAGIQLTGSFAEELAARGITEAEAQRGFGEIGALGELTQTFAGEQGLTQQQLIGGQFGYDIAAQEELARRKRGRVAAFEGGGQFARTTGATSGTISTAVGEAQ